MKSAALGDVATIERLSVKPAEITDGETYVGLENISRNGGFVDVRSVNAGEIRSSKLRFDDGHVLYGKLRPYLAKIAAPNFSGICSTDILPIRPRAELDGRYLLRYLRTPEMVAHASRLAVGINLPRLSPKTLAQFPIPIPPIEEQRRIAAILDAADALRTKRRCAATQLENLRYAIFMDLFKRSDWDAVPIAELAADTKGSIRTGPFGSQLLHSEFTDSGVAVLGIDNAVQNRFAWGERRYITEEKYQKLRRYTVLPGDVLVTIMGTCGRVAVVPDDIPTSINTKHLCCITLDQERCLPDYLSACLQFHPRVLHQLGATRGAVMPGLNMGLIKNARIPVPPIGVQTELVDAMSAVRVLASTSEASGERLDTLFASLQQRAFRGEL